MDGTGAELELKARGAGRGARLPTLYVINWLIIISLGRRSPPTIDDRFARR